jgi:hypothetical protein
MNIQPTMIEVCAHALAASNAAMANERMHEGVFPLLHEKKILFPDDNKIELNTGSTKALGQRTTKETNSSEIEKSLQNVYPRLIVSRIVMNGTTQRSTVMH